MAIGADGTIAVAFSHLAPARRLDTPDRIQDAFDRRTILVAVRRPAGRWLRTQTVSAPGAASPQVAVDARGRVLVVWVAPECSRRPLALGCLLVLGGLHARALSNADRWGPIETLARNSTLGYEGPPRPSVALDRRGAATIAYAGGRARKGPPGDSPAVYVSVRGRTGGWHTGPRVSAIPGSKPRIAVASDGEVVLAWLGARFESDHLEYGPVLAALARPGSRRFSAPRQVSAQSYTRAVRIVAGSAGETLVSWSDSPELGQPGRGLSYAVRHTGGHFGSPHAIPDADPGDAVDAGAVVMLRGGLGLWFSQPPFGRRGALLVGAREAGGRVRRVARRRERALARRRRGVLAGDRGRRRLARARAADRHHATVTRGPVRSPSCG